MEEGMCNMSTGYAKPVPVPGHRHKSEDRVRVSWDQLGSEFRIGCGRGSTVWGLATSETCSACSHQATGAPQISSGERGCAILRGPCPSTALWHRGRERSPASAWPPPCCSTTESSSCPAPHGDKHQAPSRAGQALAYSGWAALLSCSLPRTTGQEQRAPPKWVPANHLSGGSPLGAKGKRAISCSKNVPPCPLGFPRGSRSPFPVRYVHGAKHKTGAKQHSIL